MQTLGAALRTGRSAVRLEPFFFVRSVKRQDECGDPGGLLSVRPAAQLLLHRLRGPLGRPVSGPSGESSEGPGAGPDAAG